MSNLTPMSIWWLRCEVHKGMLGSEYAVVVDTIGGKASLFVAQDKVIDLSGDKGRLMVELIDRDSRYGLVRLPSGSLEGTNVVKVAADELTPST